VQGDCDEMAFLSRLDEAASAVKEATSEISPLKARAAEREVEETALIEKCSEYLFDLWDANCMEEFAIIERFEAKAILAFQDPEMEEISFPQEQLHNEFLLLFEDLIEKFLVSEGCGAEVFVDVLQKHMTKKTPAREKEEGEFEQFEQASGSSAADVVDVIFSYCDLAVWASMMRASAKQRKKYEEYRTKLASSIYSGQANRHRFESAIASSSSTSSAKK